MTTYTEIIQRRDWSALTRENFDDEQFYEELAEEFCDKTSMTWTSVSSQIAEAAKKYGKSGSVKDLLKEAKKAMPEILAKRNPKASREVVVAMAAQTNPLELNQDQLSQSCSLRYAVDRDGIYEVTEDGARKRFCHTPLTITQQYINSQNHGTMYEVRYLRYEAGKPVLCKGIYSAKTLFNKTQILTLAADGVLVNSSNAAAMVDYLTEVVAAGQKAGMPCGESTSKLGWTENGRFCPYDEDTAFDAADSDGNAQIYKALISVKGDQKEYIEHMIAVRQRKRLEINVFLAAAMTSFLMGQYIMSQSYVLHIYGPTDTGKTLGIRYAMSQLGDPKNGILISDYQGSTAGNYARLDVFNNIPFVLDDLSQASDDYKKKLQEVYYNLTNERSAPRAEQDGKARGIKTWKCPIFSTGEDAASHEESVTNAGVLNRLIEFPASPDPDVSKAGGEIQWMSRNHGHVARLFLKALRENYTEEEIQAKYNGYLEEIKRTNNTLMKQAAPLALILTADEILEKEVYKDGVRLNAENLAGMLKTAEQISDGERAYAYIRSYINGHIRQFHMDAPYSEEASGAEQLGWIVTTKLETTGKVETNAYIPNAQLKKIMSQGGLSAGKFIDWAIAKGYSERDNSGNCPNRHLSYVDAAETLSKKQRAWRILLKDDVVEAKIEGVDSPVRGERLPFES